MHPKSKKNIDFEFNIQQNWQFHTKKANGKMISTQGNTHNKPYRNKKKTNSYKSAFDMVLMLCNLELNLQ